MQKTYVKSQMNFYRYFAVLTLLPALHLSATEKNTDIPKHNSIADEVVIKPGSPQLASLKIEPVYEVFAPLTEALNGKIVFDENHTSRVFSPVFGRALTINVQAGDLVKAGQVLMLMDSPDLGSAIADARKADANFQLNKQVAERNRMLFEGGVLPQKEMDISEANLSAAAAEADRAHARLKNLGARKQDSDAYHLRSPITGIVVDRKINPGSEVRPDAPEPLFVITDPAYLWASIDLPERDLGRVSQGQKVSVQVDAYPGEVFYGLVKSVAVMVDPSTRRVPVRCEIDGRGKLKPEMYARITPLDSRNNKIIRLPNSALVTDGLYSFVFVEDSPLHFKKRKVRLDMQQREFATIKEGLKAGERVVTEGAILLNSELAVNK